MLPSHTCVFRVKQTLDLAEPLLTSRNIGSNTMRTSANKFDPALAYYCHARQTHAAPDEK